MHKHSYSIVFFSLLAAAGCSEDEPSSMLGNPNTTTGGMMGANAGTSPGTGGVGTGSGGTAPPSGGSGGIGAGGTGTGGIGTGGSGSGGSAPMSTGGTTPAPGDDAGWVADASIEDGAAADADVPATSAFPPVAVGDLTSEGSFTPATAGGTGPGGAYEIYYPQELGRDGVKHPVLTWGNGGGTTPGIYPLLPTLASQGFVIIAATSPLVDGPLLQNGLDWMLEQNGVSGSDFEGVLDTEQVGAFGYSLGSLATFAIGTDQRLKTTVHISGGIMTGGDQSQATAMHAPTAYFCDTEETGPNCDSDFEVIDDTPTFYGQVPGAYHIDYVIDAAFADRMNTAIIGWLRWQLMNDQTMASLFVGADCTLCTDSAWDVQKKNMD